MRDEMRDVKTGLKYPLLPNDKDEQKVIPASSSGNHFCL